MSLERTALRVAAVMALTNGFSAPYPTMARQLVFDSRVDPVQGVSDVDELVPTVRIMTDSDEGNLISNNNGGPPFEHRVHLVIEISVNTLGENPETGQNELIWPQTEPELDAMLDLFESQISRVFQDDASQWGRELNKLCRRIEKWDSERFIEREANVRFAARQITAVIALPIEPDPTVTLYSGETAPAAVPHIPAPLGPLLASIIADNGPFAPSAKAMRDMLIAAGGERPIVMQRFDRLRLVEADQAELNADEEPRGERADGVADVTLAD